MSLDLSALVRRRKPEIRTLRLTPRPPGALVDAASFAGTPGRPAFVPDTTFYSHQASGRLPAAARALVESALMFHCSVCLGELATGLAARDVTRPDWASALSHFDGLFTRIPDTRLIRPDDDTWIDAGLIAGTLARTQTFQRHQRKQCLNDALILLTAAKAGLPVLTANLAEFDLIQQLAPEVCFIHY